MVLTEAEVWAVMRKNPEDGLYDYVSYWTNHDAAIKDLKTRQRRCTAAIEDEYKLATTILFFSTIDRNKCWFKVDHIKKVIVNAPTYESIIAKLTDDELEVLGIKR